MYSRIPRLLAWLAFGAVIWCCVPASALQSVVPVATKISGSVTVQASDGSRHEVVTSRLLSSGDTVLTGHHSLASVELADVGRVTVGPASSALTRLAGSTLSLQMNSGLVCAESQTAAVTVTVGALSVRATAVPAIFNVVTAGNATTVAVYRGNVALALHGTGAGTLQTGEAMTSSNDEAPAPATLASVNGRFASLHCPDQTTVTEALRASTMPTTAVAPTASGGHGGGIFGWLLGFAAIAAAAGGHGGGGNGGNMPPATNLGGGGSPSPSSTPFVTPTPTPTSSSTPTPSPTPTGPPTPTPSPTSTPLSTIAVDPSSLSFSGAGGDAKTFKAEDSASRNYFASSSNTDVATVSLQDQHGHEASFAVQPAGQGTATISVGDDAGNRGYVNVVVSSGDVRSSSGRSVPCSLIASTSSLVFAGAMGSQRLSVSAPCFKGTLRARSSNDAVASIEPAGSTSSVAGFLVTARSIGTAVLTISDDRGDTAVVVRVSVIGVHQKHLRAGL